MNPADSKSLVTPRLTLWLICAGLFLGTFALFSRTLHADFLDYDDPDFVTQNTHVLSGLTWANLRWACTSGGQAAYWQPLAWASLMVDAQFQGSGPAGFHLTNILLHSLNAALAFLLFRRFTDRWWLAAWSAALFAWHPLRVESVAWISERKDVLSVFLGLVTLLAYLAYARRRESGSGGAAGYFALALAAYAAGLLSKPSLVPLPGVLCLLDLWPRQSWRGTRPAGDSARSIRALIWEKVPFALLAAGASIVTYSVQRGGGAVSESFGWWARGANAVTSICSYLGKFFWPVHLAAAYPHPLAWSAGPVIAAIFVVTAVTAVAICLRKKQPRYLVGWLWFLGMLVPVLGFVQAGGQGMADRYTYFPILGVQLALVALFENANARRTAPLAALVGVAVVGACLVLSWRQLGYWRNSTALFEHALAVTENNYIAERCRATTLLNEGRYAEAEEHCRRALTFDPRYAPAHYTLGAILEPRDATAAIAEYREAAELWPNFAPVHARLAAALLHAGDPSGALQEFEIVARLQPDIAGTFLGEGLALNRMGRSAEARQAFERAIELRPDYPEAHNSFANLLIATGHPAEARNHYRAALRANPRFAEAHFNFANSLEDTGEAEAAYEHYRAALRLQPDDPDYRLGVASALEHLHRRAEAIAAYREALAIQPTNAEAQASLAALLGQDGKEDGVSAPR